MLLWAEDSEAELRAELAQAGAGAEAACAPTIAPPPGGLIAPWTGARLGRLPCLSFARQLLPEAVPVRAGSVREWAGLVVEAVAGVVPDDQPWSLHVEPRYGERGLHRIGARAWHSASKGWSEAVPEVNAGQGTRQPEADAGRNRCRLVRETALELLQKKRRYLLRRLRAVPAPFTEGDSLVQVLLTAPEAGFISVALAPFPFAQRHLVSPFPRGEVPVAVDKAAPSRAFAKLVEAERRLGRSIQRGETCVDLGAAPGSWSYVAVARGARVIAVDRAPLREDLLRNPHVQFQAGDAFRFRPERPVNWLLCDVIAAPERSADLLLEWLRRGWCRHFVVSLKAGKAHLGAGQGTGVEAVARLKRELPALTSELFLSRLCANKHEVCAFGAARGGGDTDCTDFHGGYSNG